MKILFLSANPDGTKPLHLDEEVNKIDDCLRKSKLRDQFQFMTRWAVDASTLRQALLEEDPDIIHFSGHGEGRAGLVLVGQDNQPKPATADALSALFKLFPKIKCVLLNACYAEEQAKAIVQHVAYVVGMKQAVRDDAAIAFAAGFYDGLGYGRSIDDAFELGRSAIQFECASFSNITRKLIPVDSGNVEPLPDHLIPVLLKKEGSSIGSLIELPPSSSEATSFVEKLQKDDISEAEALKMYRIRVQEFLIDRKVTQIEKVQLAILAKVLGLSETDANRILQEEQDKQQDSASSTSPPRTTKIGTPKIIMACAALLIALTGGFLIYKQTTNTFPPCSPFKGSFSKNGTIASGEFLLPGECLKSPNQLYTLALESDGNVVLYSQDSRPFWATTTGGSLTPRHFIMQTDGNLVLYDTSGNPKWASNTSNQPGAFLSIQDDGNLVIYKEGSQTETPDNALWASHTQR
jgi:hypothetical protein